MSATGCPSRSSSRRPTSSGLDELTLTLMLALERLSPLERATFLLHDVFLDVSLNEVATTLNWDAAAVRQVAVRARKHVRAARPRYPVEREEGDRIATAFFTASRNGDLEALRAVLAQTVVLQADGGEQGTGLPQSDRRAGTRAAPVRRPASQARRSSRPSMSRPCGSTVCPASPAWSAMGCSTTALAIENGRITGICITRNPDKLSHVARALAAHGAATLLH